MEGYTIYYFPYRDDDLISYFYLYLSDDKTPNSTTVCLHLNKLISCLMNKGALKPGDHLLCITNSCKKQYQSATSLYFMSHLSLNYNIAVDWVINCADHDKSIVNAINHIDKNTILRSTRRKVSHALDSIDKDNKNMKVFTVYDFDELTLSANKGDLYLSVNKREKASFIKEFIRLFH